MRNSIVFYLNGERKSVGATEAKMMLSEYLRYDQCLTGTKVVCAEGDCGACTVLRYFPANIHSSLDQKYYSFNSCITPVATLDGSSIITVDALGEHNNLHETQRAMVECHGSQCGYCTPGFVMSLADLVEKKVTKGESSINDQEAKNSMTGNLCRCTGYDAIVDAAKNIDLSKCELLSERFYSEKQHKELLEKSSEAVLVEGEDYKFFAPTTTKEAVEFLNHNPKAHIIASSTDLGVVHNKRRIKLKHLLSLHLIQDLYKISEENGRITFGARVTMTELRRYLKVKLADFANYLDIFASPQIKNIATIVGNVATASPIGDTPPVLLALGATIHLESIHESRQMPLEDFFLDYRKTAMKEGELITAISFDLPDKAFFKSFKNSNRKDLDISTVNLSLFISKDTKKIRLAAGGVAATPIRLKKTEEYLSQNTFDAQNIYKAVEILHSEYTPIDDLRSSASYRRMLVENFFKRGISQFMEQAHE